MRRLTRISLSRPLLAVAVVAALAAPAAPAFARRQQPPVGFEAALPAPAPAPRPADGSIFNASAGYGFPIGPGLLTFRGDVYNQSGMRNALSLSPRFDVDLGGHTIFNASATYSRGDWDTTLWIKNIANTDAVNGVYTEAYMGTSPAQNYFGNGSKALVTLPRTIGITASYRF